MSLHPIRLNTAVGAVSYNILATQRIFYEKQNMLPEFKERCALDFTEQSKYLEYFLDDDTMSNKFKMNEDDKEGFIIFNEQSDVVSCLKYFGNVK
jgi:hypothetical protein